MRIFFAIDERNFEIFYDDLKGEHACASVFVQEQYFVAAVLSKKVLTLSYFVERKGHSPDLYLMKELEIAAKGTDR